MSTEKTTKSVKTVDRRFGLDRIVRDVTIPFHGKEDGTAAEG
jgi:hypothetical protein